uniref:Neuroguidin, EIF4E binding protein n=1 Tax=Eptatretus burgeri TaxID=7764 RepID=A0A8C4PW05_EPTBU
MAQEFVEEDVAKTLKLYNTISEEAKKVTEHVQGITRKVHSGEIATAKGLSILEVKYQLLLFYLMDLTHVIMKKVDGRSLSGEPAIERMVEVNMVLQKMRPLDKKLKYYVDKLVKAAVTGELGENHPLKHKPRPNNLVSKLEAPEDVLENDENDDDEAEKGVKAREKDQNGAKNRKYIPPRVAAMPYDHDETAAQSRQRLLDRTRRRALSSSMIREMQEELGDAPVEQYEGFALHHMRDGTRERNRREFEETMMTRLPVPKNERLRQRSLAMTEQLATLTHFREISVLAGEAQRIDTDMLPPKKRKKVQKKGKKGFKRGNKKAFYRKRR